MSAKRVLLVDDNEAYRAELLHWLKEERVDAIGAGSADEAEDILNQDPTALQFAVIDHRLQQENGIETTRRLLEKKRDIYVLLFTRVPSDNPETLARYRWEALSSGAYRYLEQEYRPQDAKRQIVEFVEEMRQLTQLREWVSQFYHTRQQAPWLLTQLDIGIDIIDRSFKVWFMNEAMRGIVGIRAWDLPKTPCASWHGFFCCPCFGCAVRTVFTESRGDERYFLSPLPHRKPGSLFYMRVWTRPVITQQGSILLGSNGYPLAATESVQDLTDSAQLREMPLEQRLQIIADALHSLPKPGSYLRQRQFEHVRIMTRDNLSTRFILRKVAGYDPSPQLNVPVGLSPTHLEAAERNMRSSGYGYWFHGVHKDGHQGGIPQQDFIYWPVLDGSECVALIEASGDECQDDTVPLMKPYADEVRAAVRDAPDKPPTAVIEAEKLLGRLDFQFQQNPPPPLDAIRTLVQKACELTDSDSAHVRYQEKDSAVMLPLQMGRVSAYETVAKDAYPLSFQNSWTVRSIIWAQEFVLTSDDHTSLIETLRAETSSRGAELLSQVKSACIEPLYFDGRCIGALCLHATHPQHYDDLRVSIARRIAQRVAFALHDYLVRQQQTLREKAERELREHAEKELQTLQDLAHQLRGPLRLAERAVQRAIDNYGSPQGRADLREGAGLCRKASRVASSVGILAKLDTGWQLAERRSALSLPRLLEMLGEAAEDASMLASTAPPVKFRVDRASFTEAALSGVMIDCDLLALALGHVLDNASKYSFPATTARIHGGAGFADGLRINVSSEGLSLEPGDVAKCIQHGWRSSLAQSVTGEGTGLGLWIVDNIMKAHAGRLIITPTDANHVTTVSLCFPRSITSEQLVEAKR